VLIGSRLVAGIGGSRMLVQGDSWFVLPWFRLRHYGIYDASTCTVKSRKIRLAWQRILTEFTIQNTTNMSIHYHFSGVLYGCAALPSQPDFSRFYGTVPYSGVRVFGDR